ncbi:cytochrome P450 [Dactylosporangium sp. NPDC051485]|uniref:cytochrome P450 n=1 Tax=Dactylosporangium sp. NPDC051485 TaxID=3154846 RepID=UPI00344373E2
MTYSSTDNAHREAARILRELGEPVGILDPYPRYHELRRLSPMHFSEYGSIVLTRYDDCLQVLRDPAFPADDFDLRDKYMPNWREHSALRTFGSSMIFRNPPDHTRLRRQVSGVFSPARVKLFRLQVDALVDEHLNDIEPYRSDGGGYDFHKLARALAMAVIASFIGAPRSKWRWLIGPAIGMTALINLNTTLADFETADRAANELTPYLTELIAERRREPQDDVISTLVGPREDGDALAEDELLQMLILLLVAGVQPTLSLLTNGLDALFRFPEQARAFIDDPGLTDDLVEEVLRFDTPIQTVGRITGPNATINGLALPAEMEVTAVVGAANRDPVHFAEPDVFDIHRPRTRRVASFGNGFHACVGQYLARTVGQSAFPRIYGRYPGIAPAGEPVRLINRKIRGYTEFPVHLKG